MPASVVIAAMAIVAFLILRFVIEPLYLSPLAKIPSAHWSAPLSPLWILLARKNRKENRELRAAHHRYGPVVRVSPNSLSIDNYDTLKTVYQGGFDKWRWYSVFDNYGYASQVLFTEYQITDRVNYPVKTAMHVLRPWIEGTFAPETHDFKRVFKVVYTSL
jgi:hypothetical protein